VRSKAGAVFVLLIFGHDSLLCLLAFWLLAFSAR
jgi:uncharacterized membrane protein